MKSALGSFALMLLLPVIADAQSNALGVGARIRVTSPRDHLNKYVGTIMELRGDTVVVAGRHGTRSIARENVTALDVSTGTRTQVRRSALLGFGAGALLGGVAGAVAYEEPDFFFGSAAEMGAVSALFFGGIGMVAGAVVGALQRTDRWQAAPRLRATAGVTRSGGVSIGISRAF